MTKAINGIQTYIQHPTDGRLHQRGARVAVCTKVLAKYMPRDEFNKLPLDGFRKRSGCFPCRNCQRKTRETKDTAQMRSLQLCPQCFEASLLENSINDGGDEAEYQPLIDKLYNEAVKRGGQIKGYPKIISETC